MTCIKTGCVVYLPEYAEWIYGDAFSYGEYPEPEHTGILLIRTVFKSHKIAEIAEFGNIRHFTVERIADWWDEDRTSMIQNSTLIALEGAWVNHGYDGISEPLLQEKVS